MGFCNCSTFCCALLCVRSSFAIILIGKRELVALLSLSSWCLMIVVWFFLAVPRVFLQFVIVLFPDHTHFVLFLANSMLKFLFGMKATYTNPPSQVQSISYLETEMVVGSISIYCCIWNCRVISAVCGLALSNCKGMYVRYNHGPQNVV